jgi:hypothetical protein
MSYVIRILGAIALGIYSSAGLHYYSILISRTKNDWLRLLFLISAIAALVFVPMMACGLMLNGPQPSASDLRYMWRWALFLSWIAVVWIYAICNWRILRERLGRFKDSAKA